MATENLELPLLEGGQAQKHVTMNEALRAVDAAVQLSVNSAALAAPPIGAGEGARYIVASSATGPWVGRDGDIAIRRGGGWAFLTPREGWLAFDRETGAFLYRSAAEWAVGAGFMSEGDKAKLDGVALEAAPRPLPRTVVVLGSSNAAGYGASTYAGDPTEANGWATPPTSWVGLLSAAMPGWTFINRSLSGTGTPTSIARFWTDVAPHRPSHVILATALANEGYDTRSFLSGTAELCRLCDLIGAVPVIRTASVFNPTSAAQYADLRATNEQLGRMGRPLIDALSTLDDGTGRFLNGAIYHSGDGVHANDAGYAALFSAIDPAIFTHLPAPRAKPAGAWRVPLMATAERAMVIDSAAGLSRPLQSFTMRTRIGGVASGGAMSRAFMSAYIKGADVPMRLRNVSGPFDLAVDGATLVASSVDPTASMAVRDCVVTFHHLTGQATLYIDGVLIGAGAVSGASAASKFCFGSRADATSTTLAVGYRFADCQLWSVPLPADVIADMARTNAAPQAALVFDGVMSGAPRGTIPNAAASAVMPGLPASWETAATY